MQVKETLETMVNSMQFIKRENHSGFCGQGKGEFHDPLWHLQIYMCLTRMYQPYPGTEHTAKGITFG